MNELRKLRNELYDKIRKEKHTIYMSFLMLKIKFFLSLNISFSLQSHLLRRVAMYFPKWNTK
jgi:hypothetical protein